MIKFSDQAKDYFDFNYNQREKKSNEIELYNYVDPNFTGIVLVYDLDNHESFEFIKTFVQKLSRSFEKLLVI